MIRPVEHSLEYLSPSRVYPASGDVLLVAGAGVVSGAIRLMTREPDEARTLYSHAGLVLAPPIQGRGLWSTTIIEALGRGVKVRDLEAYKGKRFAVWRHRDAPLAGRAAQYALRREGEFYGYTKLALHFADWLFFRNRWRVFRRGTFIDRWPICSYLVADAYSDAGYAWFDARYGGELNPKVATPDDLADVITASGDWWRVYP